MTHPKTCIIVLSFNGIEVTKKFLKDLYANTSNFILLMIDNGSSDGSKEYLLDFSKNNDNMTFISNDTNVGIILGRNQGYDLFKEMSEPLDYFMFLDNDQFVQSGWLQHHFDVMKESNADVIGVEAWLLSIAFFPAHQCKKVSEAFSYVGCGGMLISKYVPENVGGMFDEGFNPCYFEDPDFCFRVRKAGYNIAWNAKAKLHHLAHSTLGNNPKKMTHFRKSHDFFRLKWGRNRFNPQFQALVPSLK